MTRAGTIWLFWTFAACLAASFAVYWPALRGDYIWDDRDIYILNNRLLPRPDGLFRFWFTTEPLDYYPLAYTVYWFGVRIWGLDPLGFHVTNVVVHALAATFLAWTLKGLRFPVAALVGVLFALHPMNVESVAWMAQLKTCLAGMLAFAAAGCFVRGWRFSSFLLFALSLSSKPIAIAFPVAILVYGWWRDGRIGRSIVLQSLPFFAASLVFGVIGVYFQQVNAIGPTTIRTDSTLTRLLASSWAVWFYAWKSIAPVDLMFVYPRWNVPSWGAIAFVPAIALFAVIGWFWRKRETWGRTPLAILAVYLLMILPSSGLVDVYYWRYTYVGDHYVYQALPLVLASAVGIVCLLLHRWSVARSNAEPALIGRLAAAAAIGFFAVQSLRLSKDYKNDVTLWTATLRRNPDAWLAHTNLALRQYEAGEWNEMEKHVRAAFELRPDLDESHNNLGLVLSRQGRHEESVERHRKAAEMSPFKMVMWENLGVGLAKLGRNEEALAAFEECVRVMEAHRLNRGMDAHPLCEMANLLSKMGRDDEASATFRRAADVNPREPMVPLGRGHLHARRGRLKEAADEYRRALTVSPGNADANWHLGRIQEKLGDLDGAFQSMLAASDRSTDALLGVVWTRSASPKKELRDPVRALADAEATQPSGEYGAMVFDAYAVALAANGKFVEAVRNNDRALARCRESDVKDLPSIKSAIERLEKRGELYRKDQAFIGPTSDMTPVLARE